MTGAKCPENDPFFRRLIRIVEDCSNENFDTCVLCPGRETCERWYNKAAETNSNRPLKQSDFDRYVSKFEKIRAEARSLMPVRVR